MEAADVVIAGAGIVGLSLALELAASGLRVSVFERGRAMAESSWAAAGMLAAHDPANPPPLAALAQLSLDLYPGWLAGIEKLSGRQVPIRTTQAIQAAHAAPLPGMPADRYLSPTELDALVPNLTPNFAPGPNNWLLLDELSLDPRDLCLALPRAARAAGVKLIENCPVLSVDAQSTGVLIETPMAPIAAAHFVNCAGAWAESPALGARRTGLSHISPCKGQMSTVRLKGRQALTRVLRTPAIYLVPRGDGRVTVGATVEQAGFDKTVEAHAIARLLHAAAQLWPPLAEATIVESWAGLRPGSADGLPLIGQLPHPRQWIASGHFRNGILLAPATARVLSQALGGQAPGIDLAPFDPHRFRASARNVLPSSDNAAIPAL